MPSRVRGDTNQEGGDFHEQLATFDNPGKGCTCKKTCKPKLIQSAVLTGDPSSVHRLPRILTLFGILRTIFSQCPQGFFRNTHEEEIRDSPGLKDLELPW